MQLVFDNVGSSRGDPNSYEKEQVLRRVRCASAAPSCAAQLPQIISKISVDLQR